MTSRRFTDDFMRTVSPRLSRKETRALAQRRGYERWHQEIARKYRRRPETEERGHQDLTSLEHLATPEDVQRLNEILREEYERVGQIP